MKHCPRCGVIVDERFRVCDTCGYDWADAPPTFLKRQRVRMALRGWTRARVIGLATIAAILLAWYVGCCAVSWMRYG